MTPADLVEHIMKRIDHPTTSLKNLIEARREAKEKIGSASLKGMSKEKSSMTDNQK